MEFTIHHAAISAIDMAESVAFYEQFGFRVVLHWKDPDGELEIAHLKLGENYLEIFWYRDQVPVPKTAGSWRQISLGSGSSILLSRFSRCAKPRILSRTVAFLRMSKFNTAGLV